jgi:predicted nucleotidyltransferase
VPSNELPESSLQADRLLQTLTKHGVDFVVIGGVAGLIHGSAYPTFDLDVAYARDRTNLERLVAALEELDVTLRGAPADLPFQLDVQTLANGANFTFDTPYGSFDILADAAGMAAYEELRREARIDIVEGIEVRVASIDHLIAMKQAAGRTKDKLMVEEYIEIADAQRKVTEGGEAE